MSVDLPLPLTPVTTTRPPSGMRTFTSLRLFARHPLSSTQARSGSTGRRLGGGTMAYSPVRYLIVVLPPAWRSTSGIGPAAMTFPPWLPAPGPMSIRWSALRMQSSSCSTMMTVLPIVCSRRSVRISRLLSRLVQADRRLVQDVADADQAAADLRRQADALRFAAGQRAGLAVQRQVAQPDVEHESEP